MVRDIDQGKRSFPDAVVSVAMHDVQRNSETSNTLEASRLFIAMPTKTNDRSSRKQKKETAHDDARKKRPDCNVTVLQRIPHVIQTNRIPKKLRSHANSKSHIPRKTNGQVPQLPNIHRLPLLTPPTSERTLSQATRSSSEM